MEELLVPARVTRQSTDDRKYLPLGHPELTQLLRFPFLNKSDRNPPEEKRSLLLDIKKIKKSFRDISDVGSKVAIAKTNRVHNVVVRKGMTVKDRYGNTVYESAVLSHGEDHVITKELMSILK
ncbi:hypothetical protein KIN20_002129 [Parelaphostrongylus tenuis]|uniref:Uncharacterized protein n=1 Tax=Parelaphostrongylus tenuis TaxID=148309 RepID=A0AAD5LY15_PARTN|nr:hypothetical protein KIN20_002129 [Parelaphostrongylus tenuis]